MLLKTRYSLSLIIALLCSLSSYAATRAFEQYDVQEFLFEGHEAIVISPKVRNAESNWIWRARFFGHEPQVDLALLEQGFHVVYIDVANMFGSPEAVKLWNHFYKHCRKTYKLNKQVVLEGMSRGGLIVYNWASENTNKVDAIYMDAPVIDMKSWPAGLLSSKGSKGSWKLCMEAHDIDAETIYDYKYMPMYKCEAVAKAGIPVMHVYGNVDAVVPYSENTAMVVAAFEKQGTPITIISKDGVGHHPHCLDNPQPIVDFILENVNN